MSFFYRNNELKKASVMQGLIFFTICKTIVVSLFNKKNAQKTL